MPVFSLPDEMAHYDYAAFLQDAGGRFYLPHARPGHAVDVRTAYLAGVARYRGMRYDTFATLPARYLDRRPAYAPQRLANAHDDGASARAPYVMFSYPPAYYLVVEEAMWLYARIAHDDPVVEYFVARFVGVALLCVTLVYWYGVIRMSGASETNAAVLVAALGSLPAVSLLFASVQPDVLSAALTAAVLYFGGSWLRAPQRIAPPIAVFTALCALAATKEQYAVAAWCAAACVAIALALRPKARAAVRAIALAIVLVVPFAIVAASHATFVAASSIVVLSQNHSLRANFADAALRVLLGLRDVYYDGDAFRSFWAVFGVRGSTVLGGPVGRAVYAALSVLSLVALISVVVVVTRRSLEAVRSALRGRDARALLEGVARAHAFLAYLVLTAIVLGVYVTSSGGFSMEGRYWVPVLGALAATLVGLANKALGVARAQPWIARGAIALAAFAACAQATAFAAIAHDYYGPARTPQFENVAAIDTVQDVAHPVLDGVERVAVRRGTTLALAGFAVDGETGLPARRVVVRVGRRDVAATTGLASPSLVTIFNDPALARSGFSLRVPIEGASPLDVRAFVVDAAGTFVPFRKSLVLDVR